MLLASPPAAAGCAYDSMLSADGVTVRITVSVREWCSIGTYRVTIKRKGTRTQVENLMREGGIENFWFEDVTGDGSRDLIVWVASAGSGGYGHLDLWVRKGNRFEKRVIADLTREQQLAGYEGHDDFTVGAGVLRRTFPLYREGDANCCPSGGTAIFRWESKTNTWIRE